LVSIFLYQSVIFIFLYFLGKKISSKINIYLKFDLIEDSIFFNYLFSLFFLSLIPFFINFINQINNSVILIIFLVLNFWILVSIKVLKKDLKNITLLIIFSLLSTPLILISEIGHDAGLYHIPFQTWLKNHKISLGMANLHSRYALTTIYDYLSSIFWFNNFFTFNTMLQSSYFILFFSYFYQLIKEKNLHFLLLITPILLTFPIFQRYMILDYGSVDVSFGILAIILTIQLLKIFNNEISKKDILIYLILLTFIVLSKTTGILFLITFFIVIIYSYKKNKIQLFFNKNLLKVFVFLFCVMGLWFIRNFLLSGCFIYPVSLTCFDVSWFIEQNINRDMNLISKYKEHFSNIFLYIFDFISKINFLIIFFTLLTILFVWINLKKNNFLNKFFLIFSLFIFILLIEFDSLRGFSNISSIAILESDYSFRNNIIFKELARIILTSVASIVFILSIIKINNQKKLFKFNLYNSYLFLLILSVFILWFVKSPDPRLGFWIFILLPTLFIFMIIDIQFNISKNKIYLFFKSILIINLLFFSVFQINQIVKKQIPLNILYASKKIHNNSTILKRVNFGFKPIPKLNDVGIVSDYTWNFCWNYKDCYFNKNDAILIKLPLNYKKIVILND